MSEPPAERSAYGHVYVAPEAGYFAIQQYQIRNQIRTVQQYIPAVSSVDILVDTEVLIVVTLNFASCMIRRPHCSTLVKDTLYNVLVLL